MFDDITSDSILEARAIPGANAPDPKRQGRRKEIEFEDSPLGKFHKADKERTEIPKPETIVKQPSDELKRLHSEAAISLSRYWVAIADAVAQPIENSGRRK